MDSLLEGAYSQTEIQDYSNRSLVQEQIVSALFYEEDIILDVRCWMEEKGLFEGIINYELTDEAGKQIMNIDIAWPRGIQLDLSEPVALLINESEQNQAAVSFHGFKYFTSADAFKAYVGANFLEN